MNPKKELHIRPYARLLTMLGEQLIKDERIALVELIKNSYDADANWVKVSFLGFGENYEILDKSTIVIEDDGIGMNQKLLEKHWLNPATPEKKRRKKRQNKTDLGRVIQGEKGIGRFAILKLGRCVNIITKTRDDSEEHVVTYDFARYDDDFLSVDGKEKDLFLDEIRVQLENRKPERIISKTIELGIRQTERNNSGTIIEISNLKGSWNEEKIKEIYSDLTKLQSIFETEKSDFETYFDKNGKDLNLSDDFINKLKFLLEDRAVFKIEDGHFNQRDGEYTFILNGVKQKLSLDDPYIKGLKVFRDRFSQRLVPIGLNCGNFSFGFYIFDFSTKAPRRYQLDKEDKKILKDHRIYLYRDGIRVYPYGDPIDDWLRTDMYRGTVSAGMFLSNDQVVGHVDITQEGNPNLTDKTNREGLIDNGNATGDFIALIQIVLSYVRLKPYARYRLGLEKKESQDIYGTKIVSGRLGELESALAGNKKALALLKKAEKEYRLEKAYLTKRAETTEELAGVGLSVETASHDLMSMMQKVNYTLDAQIKDLDSPEAIDKPKLQNQLITVRGGLAFIESQLKDIQLIFTSSKQRARLIRVHDIVQKVLSLYTRVLQTEKISVEIVADEGSPLIAKTTDAVLLQLLLNLFDNSIYWLRQIDLKDKKIEIHLNGTNGTMIFSDNGPGVLPDDIQYIFKPFYSGKGEEGRGLGLYIARQLLERYDYSIDLGTRPREKILSGANFFISFIKEEQ